MNDDFLSVFSVLVFSFRYVDVERHALAVGDDESESVRETEDTDEVGLGSLYDFDDLAFVFLGLAFREHRHLDLVAVESLACVVSCDKDVFAFFIRNDISLACAFHIDSTCDILRLRTIFVNEVRMKQITIRTIFDEFAFFVESDENLIYHVFTGSVAYRHYLGDLLIIHWLERMLAKYGEYRVYKSTKAILDFFLCHM